MSKPPDHADDGFDIDNFDYIDYASALESEHPSSTDNEIESGNTENTCTPARRHKKRKASGSPLLQTSYSDAVLNTVKKRYPSPLDRVSLLIKNIFVLFLAKQKS